MRAADPPCNCNSTLSLIQFLSLVFTSIQRAYNSCVSMVSALNERRRFGACTNCEVFGAAALQRNFETLTGSP